jgi:hypothetical protein
MAKSNSQFCTEYWEKLGYAPIEAANRVLGVQHKIHETRDNVKMAKNLSLYYKNPNNTDKIAAANKKISKALKSKNMTHSPIFKEYWLSKGHSEEEAKQLVFETRYETQDGNNRFTSKIEVKFLNDLSVFLNLDINRGKFVTINDSVYCIDGALSINDHKIAIEFNGTNPHLDPRFHCEKSKTPWGDSWHTKKTSDAAKIKNLINHYGSVLIIWEYDYLNRREVLFKQIKGIINEKNKKNNKAWDSSSI